MHYLMLAYNLGENGQKDALAVVSGSIPLGFTLRMKDKLEADDGVLHCHWGTLCT